MQILPQAQRMTTPGSEKPRKFQQWSKQGKSARELFLADLWDIWGVFGGILPLQKSNEKPRKTKESMRKAKEKLKNYPSKEP